MARTVHMEAPFLQSVLWTLFMEIFPPYQFIACRYHKFYNLPGLPMLVLQVKSLYDHQKGRRYIVHTSLFTQTMWLLRMRSRPRTRQPDAFPVWEFSHKYNLLWSGLFGGLSHLQDRLYLNFLSRRKPRKVQKKVLLPSKKSRETSNTRNKCKFEWRIASSEQASLSQEGKAFVWLG